MMGFAVIAVGWLLLVVALVLLFGVWPLVPAGVAMMLVGSLVNLDRLRGSSDA